MFGHISRATLEAAANDALDSRERASVANHVLQCSNCRAQLESERALRTVIARAPILHPSANLLGRVLGSRKAGAGVIVPTQGLPERRRRVIAPALAIAASLLAILVISTRNSENLVAANGAGKLHLTRVAAGQPEFHIKYEPLLQIAREAELSLRVRVRTNRAQTSRGSSTQTVLGKLRPVAGQFALSIELPDSIAYAAFAVEDNDGQRIDDNQGRLFEYLRTAANGQPDEDAMRQQAYDQMDRDWNLALATLHRTTERFPGSLRAWVLLRACEPETDSIFSKHRPRLAQFDSVLRSKDVLDSASLAEMSLYSRLQVLLPSGQVDSAMLPVAEYWRNRLQREAPTHTRAIEDTVGRLASRPTVGNLAAIDSVWAAVPSARAFSARFGWQAARVLKTDSLQFKWAERLVASSALHLENMLSIVGTLRIAQPWANHMLDSVTASFSHPENSERGLSESRAAFDERVLRRATRWRALAGRLLVARGDLQGARRAFAEIGQSAWVPEAFEHLLAAEIALGDSVGVARAAARIVVDPLTRTIHRDSVSNVGRAYSKNDSAWTMHIAQATQEFVARMATSLRSRAISPAARVAVNGRNTPIGQVVGDSATLVVFWSWLCPYSKADLPAIARWYQSASKRGLRMLLVDTQAPSDLVTEALKTARIPSTIPRVNDADQTLALAFHASGTPAYIVTEGGRLRTEPTSDFALAVRQLEAAARLSASRASESR